MAKKMPRRMLALSSAAVTAIYFAGLHTTQVADARLASRDDVATTTAAPDPPVLDVLNTTPVVVPAQSTMAASATGYRDGTYSGSGYSRPGGVDVSVKIQGGRIASVTITGGSTQYPLSRIAALPTQIVARQSTHVDRVTGATYSVQAFQRAVQQALAKAQT